MSSPNTQKQKWIALSVLILFALGGGTYLLLHRGGTQSPLQGQGASTAPGAAVSQKEGNTPAGGGAVVSDHAASLAKGAKPAASASGTVAGAPGLGGGAPSTGTSTAMAPAAPEGPKDTCYTITYKHRSIASHTDEETCSHHKNWLKLKHKDVNAKSVCVRVNGTPVHYLSVKGHADELIFGSIAGPKSKVTVTYCTGKLAGCAQAAQDCVVPKDEFMEAIGGSEGQKGDARLGQWDPSNPSEREADVMAKLDGEVKKELETNDDLNGRAPAGEMFKDWLADDGTPACGTQQARN